MICTLHLPLVILAALNTAICIYYYLSVVRVEYCSTPDDRPQVPEDGMTKIVSLALIVLIIFLGVAPNMLLEAATQAVRSIL
jgi:NADH-quinone oxidoreductase subunit N